MKKLILISIFFGIFSLNLFCVKYFGYQTSVKVLFNIGITYNFKISTDFAYQRDALFLGIPFQPRVDIRFVEWFSFSFGVDFLYLLHIYRTTYTDEITFYNNNLIIQTPFIVKFYPLVYKSDTYENFYIGLGLFGNFWAVNTFFYEKNGNSYYGDSYTSNSNELPPSKVYTPANIGFKLCLGNNFFVTQKNIIGIELYADYLFIPYINGYSSNPNFSTSQNVLLEFVANAGIALSIGFQTNAGQ